MAENNIKDSFYKLVKLMEILRKKKGGCPWDLKQTHFSLKPSLIEETYEVIEAIDENNADKLKEELGDLLFQVIFHCQIAKDNKAFTIEDVLKIIYAKMVRRHPHVFENKKVHGVKDVLNNWEKIKKEEKKGKSREQKSILDGIPKGMPAMMRAQRVQDRASRVGFDWNHVEDIFSKLDEEFSEFKTAYKKKDSRGMEEELGDLFFVLVNIARFLEKDPETVLSKTIGKFISRFTFIEEKIAREGKDFSQYTLEGLDEIWNEAKKARKSQKHGRK
ncbi:MAG: nucleoside triphosphate pyrophosphohydrolase [bacterium]